VGNISITLRNNTHSIRNVILGSFTRMHLLGYGLLLFISILEERLHHDLTKMECLI
jgi:hypothetical protein